MFWISALLNHLGWLWRSLIDYTVNYHLDWINQECIWKVLLSLGWVLFSHLKAMLACVLHLSYLFKARPKPCQERLKKNSSRVETLALQWSKSCWETVIFKSGLLPDRRPITNLQRRLLTSNYLLSTSTIRPLSSPHCRTRMPLYVVFPARPQRSRRRSFWSMPPSQLASNFSSPASSSPTFSAPTMRFSQLNSWAIKSKFADISKKRLRRARSPIRLWTVALSLTCVGISCLCCVEKTILHHSIPTLKHHIIFLMLPPPSEIT